MPRLPNPGSDDGTWGAILNEFLDVAHNPDGTLSDTGVLAAKADDNAVIHNTGDETIGGFKTFSLQPKVPTPTFGTDAANKTYVDNVATSGAPDATTTTKGIVQLAGDLSGTATSPQIAAGVIVDADVNTSAAIAQSKVANLSSDLASKASTTDLTNHANDTTAIHGIADTSVLETTTGSQTRVDTHVNDSLAAHAASAIAFIPTGTVAATDVQTAIAEVAAEAGGTVPDATTGTKGIVQLAGDLAGTATSPQIATGVIVDADINASAAIAESKLNLASDAAAGTASRRTLGTGATQAAAGNDARLSDARTPTAHASTHAAAGSDPVTLTMAQITGLVASIQAALALTAIIKTGSAAIGNNLLPPGIKVGYTTTITAVSARCGTAPTGAALIVRVNRNGSSWQTLTIAAGTTSISNTGLSLSLAAGDILTFDITQVGSTVAGADVAFDAVGA